MIPVRLLLKNFLSYGSAGETIEFGGIHVACLCGPNGHGKSALLDAITWSLWGKARGSHDDLVRVGQTSMVVELEFELDDQLYRVVRRRTRGRTGQSDLQFQVQKPEGDWHALTGQGVTGTQRLIERTLRMDYDTFVNSAFILQGRADEFARRTPGERKRILSEILNLGLYEQLTEKARELRASAATRVHGCDREIVRLQRERAALEQLEAEVAQLTLHQEAAHDRAELLRAQYEEVSAEAARLEALRDEREERARRSRQLEGELGRDRGQLQRLARDMAQAEARLAQAAEIRARAARMHSLREEQQQFAERLNEVHRLTEERRGIERRIEQEERVLETALVKQREEMKSVHGTIERWERTRSEREELQVRAREHAALTQRGEVLQERLQEIVARQARAEAERANKESHLKDADERFQLLKEAALRCPLCEADLEPERRRTLGFQLREERSGLKLRIQQSEADAQQAREEQVAAEREQTHIRHQLRRGQRDLERLAELEKMRTEAETAALRLPMLEEQEAELERRLRERDCAREDRALLRELDARMGELRPAEGRQREVGQELQMLLGADRELHALEAAEAALPALRQDSAALQQQVEEKERTVLEDRERLKALDLAMGRLAQISAEQVRRRIEWEQAAARERDTAQKLGEASARLAACARAGEELAERRREREEAARDQTHYEELARAFGRNGIQAQIIEHALPEIETEANLLLNRMTEGQLAVQLKTQRETRAGTAAETLEIEISDGHGPRRYELYSGGEAFRVNFALRVALSRLLARRAGARLQTLVIDEGFGSQDQEGRFRLVEAIEAVKDDFARILVVTHLDDLKEAFPARIEVTKDEEGSHVSLV